MLKKKFRIIYYYININFSVNMVLLSQNKQSFTILMLCTQKCITNQPHVDIKRYMKTKIQKKIRQVYIAPFAPPFNFEILLAEIVSQTLFFVIIKDRIKSMKLWTTVTF